MKVSHTHIQPTRPARGSCGAINAFVMNVGSHTVCHASLLSPYPCAMNILSTNFGYIQLFF